MIVSKVSDQFSDITILLELSEWIIQLHTSLYYLLIDVLIYVRGLYTDKFLAPNFHNGAPVADIADVSK